jgi:hypothetical protein
MDQTLKPLARSWFIYLAGLTLSSLALIVLGEKPLSPRSAQVVDLSASRPGSIAELSKSKEWMQQVRFFNKAYFGPESADWHDSPASLPSPQSILQMQRPLSNDRFSNLWFSGPAEGVPDNSYGVSVQSKTYSYANLNIPANVTLGPFLRSNDVSFKALKSSGWGLFSSDVSQVRNLALDALAYDQPSPLVLPVAPEYQSALGKSLSFRIQLLKFDPENLTIREQHEAAAQSSDIPSKIVEGSLEFDTLKVANDFLIAPAGRYTTLIISADRDPRPFITCTRTDNGAVIGTYSDQVPLIAVAVNSWASVKVHAATRDFGQKMNYKIVSLSSNDVDTKALFLWFVAHDLTDRSVEGRILSLPEIDARAKWLKTAFDVEITAQDVANTSDPDIRKLLDHLHSVQ